MKKALALILALILLLSAAACGSTSAAQETTAGGTETTAGGTETAAPAAETAASGAEAPASGDSEAASSTVSYEISYQSVKAWTNSFGTNKVQIIVEITNTGSAPIYLSSGAYDLEDASGTLLASESMLAFYPHVLAAGEKGYIYEAETLDADADTELVLSPAVEAVAATVDLIRCPVTDIALSDDENGNIKVTGNIENTSGEDGSSVYIALVMYDADDLPIGLVYTSLTSDIINEFNSGAPMGFEMTSWSLPEGVTAASVASYTVYAYPYQHQLN